jgi:hypothetical protein
MTNVAYGQTGSSKDVIVVNTPAVNVVNAPTVGIDPAKNTVRLPNTPADPLAVKLAGEPARRPFQMGVNVAIQPGATSSFARLPIPAATRLVIEDVSAVTSQPQGQPLFLKFTTAVDDALAVGDENAFEDHSLVLSAQGVFNGSERSTAHERTMIFADESVQTTSGTLSGLEIRVELARGGSIGTASVRITFSGYIEDLPGTSVSR